MDLTLQSLDTWTDSVHRTSVDEIETDSVKLGLSRLGCRPRKADVVVRRRSREGALASPDSKAEETYYLYDTTVELLMTWRYNDEL